MKKIILISVFLSLAACQSSQKNQDRNPAGNGEIGSVNITTVAPSQVVKNLNNYRQKANQLAQQDASVQYDRAVVHFRQFCSNILPDQSVDLSQKKEMDKFKTAQQRMSELVDAVYALNEIESDSEAIQQSRDLMREINFVINQMGVWGRPNWQKYFYPLCQAIK